MLKAISRDYISNKLYDKYTTAPAEYMVPKYAKLFWLFGGPLVCLFPGIF